MSPAPAATRIAVVQTSDPERYLPLYRITSAASEAFCRLHGLEFAGFVGIKRGWHPWQATYNRIPILAGMVADGFDGWVVYLDADSYVFDLRFDIRAWLAVHGRYALIGAPGGTEPWQVNSGILMLNLAHPEARSIVMEWHGWWHARITDAWLRSKPEWTRDVVGDQALMHDILRHRDHARLLKLVPLELLGASTSSFIRQVLRAFGDFDARCRSAEEGVRHALARLGGAGAALGAPRRG